MNFFKHFKNDETGQILIISLIILAVGCMFIIPLLGLMSTNLNATLDYQDKMKQSYACDSGIEDAAHKLLKDEPSIVALSDGESYTYTLTSNGLPVNVTVTKVCLLEGLMGDDEYKYDQPHEDWVGFEIPTANITRNYEEDWVEYYCTLNFEYLGVGTRNVESIGAYFSPFPGDTNLIEAPYEIVYEPVMTSDNLLDIETKVANGGFTFIWRWLKNAGPEFDKNNQTGSVYFKFKVYDADWQYRSTFIWSTFKEQDVSYVTNAQLNEWLIESSTDQTITKVQALEDEGAGSVEYITWERKLQQ
jgi:hypothetical protein